MKASIFAVAALCGISVVAQAAEITGRLTLTVYPRFGNGVFVEEVRQEGSSIYGMTSFGRNSNVNFEYGSGHYSGSAGGDGWVDLTCSDTHCSGLVGGENATFDVKIEKTDKGTVTRLEGGLNYNHLIVTRDAAKIEVSASGHVELESRGDGLYEGSGALNRNPSSLVDVKLETSGTLKDVADPGLLAILVAQPFSM